MAKTKYFIPKNDSQKALMGAMDNKSMAFAVGPAGGGKTFAAVGIATSYLKQKLVKKIIVCRPAIEAGEALGFLPGTAEEKLKPYLVPIFESIAGNIKSQGGNQNAADTVTRGPDIEIVAFSYMRGRSFHDSFIVVDEAQNATLTQLEMVMTRIGVDSKMIITGDLSQTDLKNGQSGLPIIINMLKGNPEVPIVEFTEDDNLRHPIVGMLTKIFKEYHTGKTNNK
jgi:phosphate starvation-inducible PhoH-like protein